SRCNESVQEVVRLHAEALAAGDLDPRTPLIFIAKLVAKFGSAARRERDHLVGEVRIAIGGFAVAESAESFDHRVLRLRLACIDDVVNFRHIAEVWMISLAIGG